MPKTFKPVLLIVVLTLISGCTSTKITAGETELALCQAWGSSLPTRSRADTKLTQDEIGHAYADFAAACPEYLNLIPLRGFKVIKFKEK